MAKFASGKEALAICDRCGQRYDYNELREEVHNGKKTGFWTCPTCFEPDHPQNFVRLLKVDENPALKRPRPDITLENSRELWGWNPVGHASMEMMAEIGTVRVTTNQ